MKTSFLPAALALLMLTGAAEAQSVAQRGNMRLTVQDIQAMLEKTDPAARAKIEESPSSLAAFVRDRMLDQALLEEARAKGWDQRPEVIQRANEARDAVIVQAYLAGLGQTDASYPSDADISAAYEANKSRLAVPRQYRLAQIFLQVPQGSADDDIRRKAAELRAQVTKPKADFADIAKKQSQDKPSAEKGGDLGWLREDALLPALRDTVAGLAEGGTSDPIRLPDGFHILRLIATKPAGTAPLADVKPQIVQALRQARAQQIIRAHADDMLREQPIQLNEIDLARQVLGPR